MNEHALYHSPDSRYCFAVSQKEIVLRLRTAREENIRVYLVYGAKYGYQTSRREREISVRYTDRLYDYYEERLELADVRLAYIFRIEEEGISYYFSEDGLTEQYDFDKSFYNFFQFPYINPVDVMPVVDWMRGAVFYQIFPDRFCRGDFEKADDYIDLEWGGKPTPKNFAGGDLKGIIRRLDHLEGLGVTAIYLTPVFSSISNHKYDIRDYKSVDPQFGTNEDLRELVRQAHERGIRVVLDAVFNHCSDRMEQFQDVLQNGRKSPYFDWFVIDGERPDQEEVNYECFASCNYMPKLNTSNRQLQDFLLDIALYWIREADIDGWRLDVADEVSHVFWRRFRDAVKSEKKDFVIIGENWHDAYPYLMGDQYDSIMNYSFTKACLDYFGRGMNAAGMAARLNGNLMRNTAQVNQMMLNLLDSHDTLRFLTEVKGNKDRLLCGIALLAIFPGAMCLYYGTEICMEGGYDPDSRRCFDWEEGHWDQDFLGELGSLLVLKKHPLVQYGEIAITSEKGMLVVTRKLEQNSLTLWINLSPVAVESGAWRSLRLVQGHRFEGKLLADGYVIFEES